MLTGSYSYIIPYFYISSYAADVLGISRSFSLSILLMALAASFFGRLSAGFLAHHLGPILTWLCCASVSSVLCFTWIAVSSQNGLIVFSVFWGFCSAGLVTLPAAVFPSLCPDPKRLGTRLGMSWGISSFASLIGSPIAGAILKHKSGVALQPKSDYVGSQLWAGLCMLVGASIICVLWIMTMRSRKSNMFI
jgi:predicted MFS family arabinose efflux permease